MPRTTAKSVDREKAAAAESDAVVDAVLHASRVLVSVAARSLAEVDRDVTVPQFRALVVLASRGPQHSAEFAEALGVHSSTATRMCDRLAAKRLITRTVPPENRREVLVTLTDDGRRIVESVTRQRRREIAKIVEAVPKSQRASMVRALHSFGNAAGEVPDTGWALGWVEE